MRDTVSMYLDITPLVHEHLLKSLPQQAGKILYAINNYFKFHALFLKICLFKILPALFFNNCMYLAHELNRLNIQISNLLTDKVVTTFVDFVEPLRSEGYKILDAQIQSQKQQLLEILENSGKYPSCSTQ